MRKFFQRHLPDSARVQQRFPPWLRGFHHPNLWHLHRRSVAGGVAVGLFCGLIPGPLQMIGAAGGAVLCRVNIAVAVLSTLYTNPVTIVPLYWVAYQIGAWLTGAPPLPHLSDLALPELHWQSWMTELARWLGQLGKPLFIGLPLLGISLAILGYVVVRLFWRIGVIWQWRKRKLRRGAT
ncbi:MAG: DUF2062 domain-containing protein [Gallionella sp.]|nr:DUF2062 domain-containing protein [Gallionella sp.]